MGGEWVDRNSCGCDVVAVAVVMSWVTKKLPPFSAYLESSVLAAEDCKENIAKEREKP